MIHGPRLFSKKGRKDKSDLSEYAQLQPQVILKENLVNTNYRSECSQYSSKNLQMFVFNVVLTKIYGDALETVGFT